MCVCRVVHAGALGRVSRLVLHWGQSGDQAFLGPEISLDLDRMTRLFKVLIMGFHLWIDTHERSANFSCIPHRIAIHVGIRMKILNSVSFSD